MNIQDKLNDFKNNKLKKDDLTFYEAFMSIYNFKEDAQDNEVVTITSSAFDAWLKDEEGYSIIKISDFLALHYFKGDLTLQDIQNARRRDILCDAIQGNVYYIANDKVEMER